MLNFLEIAMAVESLFRRRELILLMGHKKRPIRDSPEVQPEAAPHLVGLFGFLIIRAKCLLRLFCRVKFTRKPLAPVGWAR